MAAGACLSALPSRVQAEGEDNTRFLLVLTSDGRCIAHRRHARRTRVRIRPACLLNVYPDNVVQSIPDSPFRAIDLAINNIGPLPYAGQSNQSNFVRRHAADMMVCTHTGTSVNHLIAEKRSLTGNDAWAGKTLQEAVASTYGDRFPIPNVNMGIGGFVEPGVNTDVPNWARGQVVGDARLFFAGLDGSRGIQRATRQITHRHRSSTSGR